MRECWDGFAQEGGLGLRHTRSKATSRRSPRFRVFSEGCRLGVELVGPEALPLGKIDFLLPVVAPSVTARVAATAGGIAAGRNAAGRVVAGRVVAERVVAG